MLGEPTDFWGKLHRDKHGKVLAWHPLEAHCADVAACCEALLRDTLLGKRFARIIGQDVLSDRLRDRLTVLALMHDLGKYAISFQNRPYPDRRPQGGHVEPIVQALSHSGAIQERILGLLSPLTVFGDAWGNYLFASISHHGRPEKKNPESSFEPSVFNAARGLDPLAGIARLVTFAQRWCARAFEPGTADELLPDNSEAQHFFAGLVMLSDWLGSDKSVFEFADDLSDPMSQARERASRLMRDRFLSMERQRACTRLDFQVFGPTFTPRAAQSALDALRLPPHDRGSLTVLEAETGSGKTESAVHRFAQLLREGLVDGLYFALPTRTSATQIHERLHRAVQNTFESAPPRARPPVTLAVPGYLRVDDQDGRALPDFDFLWPDKDVDRHRTWAVENSKRYLAGSVVVGTIDQVLLSTLAVSHSHLRATAMTRLFLIVDEVHASDSYMTALLDRVLAFHIAAGGHALLMSATLGIAAQARYFARLRVPPSTLIIPSLLESSKRPYPLITSALYGDVPTESAVEAPGIAKHCSVTLVSEIEQHERIAARCFDAARRGAQVLVIRNTVSDAIATQRAIESLAESVDGALLFRVGDSITLHHARFAEEDRKQLDHAIESRLGKDAPRTTGSIVVATQTVQQSLDIDADFLITDLCPMDVLLQRIGRLHRHARSNRPVEFADARCVVLDPGPLVNFLRDSGDVRSKHGIGSVYEDLRILEATRQVCLAHPNFTIPEDNRWLVEHAMHPEALAAVATTDSFRAHERKFDALTMVERQLAGLHGVERHRPFGDYGYPDRQVSGRIATRLGEADRLIELETPFRSSLGSVVRRLKIPHWLAREIPNEPRVNVVADVDRVLISVVNEANRVCARFIYDRFGLRAAEGEENDADE